MDNNTSERVDSAVAHTPSPVTGRGQDREDKTLLFCNDSRLRDACLEGLGARVMTTSTGGSMSDLTAPASGPLPLCVSALDFTDSMRCYFCNAMSKASLIGLYRGV